MSFFDQIGGDNNAEGVDERMASGGGLPPGFYRAVLDGARDSESKTNNTPCYELTFLVTDGPFKGATFTEKVYKSGKDNAATAKCRDRVKMFWHRLGGCTKSADGKVYVPIAGKESFGDCLDTPCVIEIHHEKDRDDPEKKWPRMTWGGIFTPADPVAVAALANGGKRPAAPAAETKANAGQVKAGASPPPPPPPAAPAGRRRTGVDAL
jgi:hypothetical protein